MTPETARAIRRLHERGHPPHAIAAILGVSVGDVRDDLRRMGARMDAEWEPPMRPDTKMLKPKEAT